MTPSELSYDSPAAHLIADQLKELDDQEIIHTGRVLVVGGAAAVLHGIRPPNSLFERRIDIDVHVAESPDRYIPFPGAHLKRHTARAMGRRTMRLEPYAVAEDFSIDLIVAHDDNYDDLLRYLDDPSVPTIGKSDVHVVKPIDALRLKLDTRRGILNYKKREQDKKDIAGYKKILGL